MPSLTEHPTVKRYYERKKIHSNLKGVSKLDAANIRKLCMEFGADDVGFVEIERQEVADQKDDALRVFPPAKTFISFVCRINRENLRNSARSIANMELHHVIKRMEDVSCKIAAYFERLGIRAITPSAAFPMETDRWPDKMWVLSHKPIAEAAGLGRMGLHRNIIHPEFGSHVSLGTVVIEAELNKYDSPINYNPCIDCKLCTAACPTGAISADGHFNFVNCLTHSYRELLGGFTDWVENIAESKNARDYRSRVSDPESVSLWQSLSGGSCYKSVYCMAVCPGGEDVIGQFLENRKGYIKEVVKPLQNREENVYVLKGSDAENYVTSRFPHKKVKQVGIGLRPPSIALFLKALPLVFQRNKSEGLNVNYHFTFTGKEEAEATVIIRNKTVVVQNGHKGDADIHISADSRAWLGFLHKDRSIFMEIILRRIRVKGSIGLLKKFGECFVL
jgi:Fe-S-cluster-containing hydrogenase component 2